MNTKYLLALLILSVSAIPACNLFGGISKPSNDEQYLIAARACLDHGDYACALTNYQALSSSKNDEKISETSLTTLAQNGIFSFSDLIGTLGSARGNGASLTSMGNLLAQRGKTTSAIRQIIQETYTNNGSITNTELRGFAKFISALSMFNSILGTLAGADGVLTATDIASGGSGCSSTGCDSSAACDAPSSGNLGNFSAGLPALQSDLADSINVTWNGSTDLYMLLSAAKATQGHIGEFTNASSDGIFQAIDQILTFPGGTNIEKSRCARAQLISILGL